MREPTKRGEPHDAAASGEGAFPTHRHDHERCIATALGDAELVCRRRQARLTPLRRRVLEIVWQSHRPLGAYAILDILSSHDGRQAAPPTVYRALEFLQENGLVHRIASLNAYVGCPAPGHGGQGQFLICTDCGSAAELVDGHIEEAVRRGARGQGFEPNAHLIEVTGRCPNCR